MDRLKGETAEGGRRAAITLLDQGVASVSNFGVGIAVARGAGASGLGGFAFSYAGWIIVSELHRSLITDPMAIERDVTEAGASREGVQRGFAAELLLGLTGTLCFVLIGTSLILSGQRVFGSAMLAMAAWLPVLLTQDYWRWIGFMSRKPRLSLANDTVFNIVQGVALVTVFVCRWGSEASIVACWGVGGLVATIFGLFQFKIYPTLRGGVRLLRARWSVSKWIASGTLTGWASQQMYVFIAGVILGPAGLGSLKAAQTLVAGPSGVLIQAGGSIGLPEASKAHAEKGWRGLIRVARVVGVAGVASFLATLAVIVLWGRPLLVHVYGPTFGHLESTAILFGIAYVFAGFSLGPILVLKATRKTRFLFHVQMASLVVSIPSMLVMCAAFRVPGAAEATIVVYCVVALAYRLVQYRVGRTVRAEEKLLAPAPTPLLEMPGDLLEVAVHARST